MYGDLLLISEVIIVDPMALILDTHGMLGEIMDIFLR
jgi:hypothetical protein